MNAWKKALITTASCFSFIFIGMISFLWWNNYPPLPLTSQVSVIQVSNDVPSANISKLKVASYNIHFGVGTDWKNNYSDKKAFYKKLDRLADILLEMDADIVLLQEVDFNSKRSYSIDQAEYLAKKANYNFIAKAVTLREKFHPSFHGMHGHINYGLCILSKYPMQDNKAKIFNYPKDIPFYLRWIYCPHGMQQAKISIGNTTVNVINVHLEPWSQITREKQTNEILNWINETNGPIVLGGDFNAVPPETPKKMGYHMNDAPWFVDRSTWDIENEKTIEIIRKIKSFTEAIPPHLYLQNEPAAFTFPSHSPNEKIDYLFAGKGLKILYGYVYHLATTASDHLPIVAYIRKLSTKKDLSCNNPRRYHKI